MSIIESDGNQKSSGHSAIIVVDKYNYQCFTYDPNAHRTYNPYYVEEMENIISRRLKKFGYQFISNWEYCPSYSLTLAFKQQPKLLKQTQQSVGDVGFCSVHTLFVIDTFLNQDKNFIDYIQYLTSIIHKIGILYRDIIIKFHSYVTNVVLKEIKMRGYKGVYNSDKIFYFIYEKYPFIG